MISNTKKSYRILSEGNFPVKFKKTIERNNNLKRYLESLAKGRPFTDRSWLYDGYNSEELAPNEILEAWLAELDSLREGTDFEKEVFQFDISQVEKWGPQGGVEPIGKLMDLVTKTYSLSNVEIPLFKDKNHPRNKYWEEAKLHAVEYLQRNGVYSLRPVSYEHAIDDFAARDSLSSNSGYPLWIKRNRPEAISNAIVDAADDSWMSYPGIILFRNYNGKTRPVVITPMATNVKEATYMQPLQSAIVRSTVLSNEFFAPWKGFETVRNLVTEMYANNIKAVSGIVSARNSNVIGPMRTDKLKFARNSIVAVCASDFSETDMHFQKAQTEEVFDVIELAFQRKYSDDLHRSVIHMHEAPLLTGPDTLIIGDHGVASGSTWTNFVETIFDLILGYYVSMVWQSGDMIDELIHKENDPAGLDLMEMTMKTSVVPIYGIGDDMSWIVTVPDIQRSHMDEILSEFKRELEILGADAGMQIKAEKTTAYPHKVKTLQRLFQKGYRREDGYLRAVYPTVRALKSLVYPEKTHNAKLWNKDMFAIRSFMILENCVDHPLFDEFVRFVCRGNDHLVKFAKLKAHEQDDLFKKAKLLPGLNVTYNQEKRNSKLSTFRSLEIAKEM